MTDELKLVPPKFKNFQTRTIPNRVVNRSPTHIFSIYIPQSVIVWIIISLIAGWLAGTISRGRGFGCIADIIVGMVGAILGGWIFSKLNIHGGE